MIELVQDGGIRGFLHTAGEGLSAVVLAHGAGSDCRSRLLVAVAGALADAGITTLRIDLPFRQARPHGPPHPSSAANDRAGIAAAVAWLRRRGHGPVAIGGHSYGGRQSSMLAAEDKEVASALLLLSYPLHPPRRSEQMRTAHWPTLDVPALFVHGTRDPFGSPEELQTAAAALKTRFECWFVENSGHELKRVVQHPGDLVQAWLRFTRGTVAAANPSK